MLMFQGEEGENIKHEKISRIESADEWTYKINVEQNTSFCEPTPFYPPTPTLFDTSTAGTENHRTGQDACVAEALLQLKFQSTSTNVPTMNAKEKCKPSYTKRIYSRPKDNSICGSENRINVLLDLLCEEKEKCRRFNECNIKLEKETNDLKNEVDSLTGIIRMLQTQNLLTGINTDTSLVNDQQEWQTSLETTSQKLSKSTA